VGDHRLVLVLETPACFLSFDEAVDRRVQRAGTLLRAASRAMAPLKKSTSVGDWLRTSESMDGG